MNTSCVFFFYKGIYYHIQNNLLLQYTFEVVSQKNFLYHNEAATNVANHHPLKIN